MTPSFSSDLPLSTTDPDAVAANGYAPSVPISVYRELATELKTTQAMVDALTRQNQQLTRQNKLLRHEIQRFVQSAEQLAQFAGVAPPEAGTVKETRIVYSPSLDEPLELESPQPQPAAAPASSAIVPREREPKARDRETKAREREPKRPRPEAAAPRPQLFTEQREEFRRSYAPAPRSQDLGNLWLVTTILLVVFTAFGAGFLIMRPLLNR